MARENDVNGLGATQLVIAPGATNAILVSAVPGEVASLIKYSTGGSLEIVQAPYGASYTGASLVPLIGTGYLMGVSEVISLTGPARYYLIATGATTTVMNLRGLSSGY